MATGKARTTTREDSEAKALAAAVDCFTEQEFQLLASVTEGTAEAWRKRGQGPAYILLGNRYLYPRSAVAEYLKTLLRERAPAPAKGLL